jgi:hypothetical protein
MRRIPPSSICPPGLRDADVWPWDSPQWRRVLRYAWLADPEAYHHEVWIALHLAGPHARMPVAWSAVYWRVRTMFDQVFRRTPTRPVKKPAALRPSKQQYRTGYRTDSQRKTKARMTMPRKRRQEIARYGNQSRHERRREAHA